MCLSLLSFLLVRRKILRLYDMFTAYYNDGGSLWGRKILRLPRGKPHNARQYPHLNSVPLLSSPEGKRIHPHHIIARISLPSCCSWLCFFGITKQSDKRAGRIYGYEEIAARHCRK